MAKLKRKKNGEYKLILSQEELAALYNGLSISGNRYKNERQFDLALKIDDLLREHVGWPSM